MRDITYYDDIISGEYHFDVKVKVSENLEYYLGKKGHEYEASGSLISLVTRAHTFGTRTVQLGRADSREIELSLFGTSARIPRNAKMVVYVKAVSDEGLGETDWFEKGTFFIDTRSKDGQLINGEEVLYITGYDAMMRGECIFPEFDPDDFHYLDGDEIPPEPGAEDQTPQRTDGYTTTYEILKYAADKKLFVSIDEWTEDTISGENLHNMNPNGMCFKTPLPTQYSIREALQNIAALYGGSFIINDIGELELVTLWRDKSIYDLGSNCQNLTVYDQYRGCKGIRMLIKDEGYQPKGQEEKVEYYFYGNQGPNDEVTPERDGYVYEIGSPWGTQDQTEWLYRQMQTRRYWPFEALNAELDLRVEIGDRVNIRTSDGNGITEGGVYTQEITFGPYITSDFGGPGEEEIDHEYSYETSKDRNYTRRLYNAEALLSIHSDEIMARVTRESPEGQTGFWWKLLDDSFTIGNEVDGNPHTIFEVNSEGGTFYGKLEAGEIYIPQQDDPNTEENECVFMVDPEGKMEARNAIVHGTIQAEYFQTAEGLTVATTADLDEIRRFQEGYFGGGMLGAMQAASLANKGFVGRNASVYPDALKVGELFANTVTGETVTAHDKMYSPSYIVGGTENPQGEGALDLATHGHAIVIDEVDGEIEIKIVNLGGNSYNSDSFSIASTRTYRNMVEALTVTHVDITCTPINGGKEYLITVVPRNSSGQDVRIIDPFNPEVIDEYGYDESGFQTTTGTAVYNMGWSDALNTVRLFVGDPVYNSDDGGQGYPVRVYAQNQSGVEYELTSTNTGTAAYWNGYNAAPTGGGGDYAVFWIERFNHYANGRTTADMACSTWSRTYEVGLGETFDQT